MTLTYSVIRYKSIHTDGRLARISIGDGKGGEYFAVIPDDEGPAAYRENRDRAIELIADAIEAGNDPGEVEWPSMT